MTPFVKWAGGKRQLINNIKELMPRNYEQYFEPFIGGGAVLFEITPKNAIISDMNKELITTYKVFKSRILFNQLMQRLDEYEKNHSEVFYYEVREKDRDTIFSELSDVEVSARFIYLNKACFNGLYRVNSKGFFNVPFGKKEKLKTYSKENLDAIHEYFANNDIKIYLQDFEKTIASAKKGDFVYFDPPYDTIENKNSFTAYNENNFDRNAQIRLCNAFKELDKKGVYLMLSNHNTSFIQTLYKEFNIHIVKATRMINSKSSERGPIEEVLITNYGS
jgi:DNA adenine methylase